MTSKPSVDLVHLACDCCGARDERLMLEKAGALTGILFRLVKCKCCGFLYFNPRPTEESIRALYDNQYYRGKGFDPYVDYFSDFDKPDDQSKLFHPAAHAGRLLAFKRPPARLLDFGCGLGDFARQARKLGYEVDGFEISGDARDFCRRHGLKVTDSASMLETEAYDIVTAIEVLEHAFSPAKTLDVIFRSLRPGGVFLYTTANLRLFEIMHSLGLARDNSYLAPEGHLNFFARDTAARFLRNAGFSRLAEPFYLGATGPKQKAKNAVKRWLGLQLPSAIK